jgi:hypothetical protein
MKDYVSLEDRHNAFKQSESKKSSEARKILNYVTAVEKYGKAFTGRRELTLYQGNAGE